MLNLKLAVRMLLRTPFVTVVAILSLALGIGANAAIFSMFNRMVLRPLPVVEPDRLVNFANPGPKPGSQSCNNAGNCDEVFSYPMFRDLEKQQTSFLGIAAHRTFGANLAYKGDTVSSEGTLVSGSYFQVLGLTPALGRLIGPADDATIGEAPIVVLSYDYWRTRFQASDAVLNQTLTVNGHPLTIVGVAPRGFEGTTLGSQPRVFVPISLRAQMEPGFTAFDNRRSYWAYLFGRLKPGVTLDQATSSLGGIYHAIVNDVEAPLQTGMSEATMARFKEKALVLTPGDHGQSSVTREAKQPLIFLLGVTIFVLLIACANIANLLLARASARSAEMAVRLSIGASRWSLVRQLLTESLLLALAGGAAGLLVARWTLTGILTMMPGEAAALFSGGLDPMVMAFAGALAVGTGLLFGLFPAIHSSRPNLLTVIKGQSGQPGGSRSAKWFRVGLATFQIMVSMVLLGGAGLFIKSLANVSRVDLGLNADNVITFGLSPELNAYPPERSKQLFMRVEEELAAQPGVTSVSAALVPVLSGSNWGSNVSVEGFKDGPDVDTNSRYNEVGPGYFRTMGMPLIAGREFTTSDAAGAPKVAIVNETFAKKFNLGRAAVGKRMEIGNGGKLDIEIVGLVQDAKYADVTQEIPPLFFVPYRQNDRIGSLTFYARTGVDPEAFLGSVMPFMKRIDADLPVENLRTLPQQVRENVFQQRIISTLAVAFASLATVLAAVGLYGVLAYTVAQRTREFGLRMALGAAPGRVRRLVMRQVIWMTIIGGAVGLGFAVLVGNSLRALLYQMEGTDPAALGSAAVVLGLVALAAGFVPALRASRLDPMKALRYE
ncbi:MAG: ABC transporter permease [Vicinamibacterales bacterium]